MPTVQFDELEDEEFYEQFASRDARSSPGMRSRASTPGTWSGSPGASVSARSCC